MVQRRKSGVYEGANDL